MVARSFAGPPSEFREGDGLEDRLMTGKELAAYLSVNERTVLKLVAEGTLPGVKVGNQWRFRKGMVDAWLDDQALGVTPRYVEGPRSATPRLMLELSSCFEPSHVVPSLTATTKTTVIEEMAAHAHSLELVTSRTWFVGALIERENVMPTALGHGVAFMHTLHRHPEHVVRPFMVLGRSLPGVDFDALDGRPTHLFFVLGLKYSELHLPWLQKLSHMLATPGRLKSLLDASDQTAIYDALSAAERDLKSSPEAGKS